MSAIFSPGANTARGAGRWLDWWPVALGLAVLYLPTYAYLWRVLWQGEEQSHGLIVLLLCVWLFWRQRREIVRSFGSPAPIAGGIVLGFGLLCYVTGQSQHVLVLEVGSQVPVVAGILLVAGGWSALRAAWFPLLFLAFLTPPPAVIINPLTASLKQDVSEIVEHLLYRAGYPIARSGVVLSIGQYQLLVADACSGMHSVYSITALGLLYLYLMRHPQWWRNALLVGSLIPLAVVANVIRVIILVLVTYHFGDAAGRGFVHGFTGIFLFIVALGLVFALDAALGVIAKMFDSPPATV